MTIFPRIPATFPIFDPSKHILLEEAMLVDIDLSQINEEELRKNPAYCRSMDYMAAKMKDAEKRYGSFLAKSPAQLLISDSDIEKIARRKKSKLFNFQKESDKDKKVVNISDYRF